MARIIDLIYDWYLSGMAAPEMPSTTVAAPMFAPLRMKMLSHAIEMSAPAEAALLSMNAYTGLG